MVTKKRIMLITSITIILCLIVFLRIMYVNNAYKKVYQSRHNASYQELIDNGSLNAIKNHVFNNIDSLFTSDKLEHTKEQQAKISLSDIKNIDGNLLLEKGFQYIIVIRGSKNEIQIHIEKEYMTYNRTPTDHLISYFSNESKIKSKSYKKIDKQLNWYFQSYDNNEHDNDNFLAIEWLTKYKEAEYFFKRKKEY